MIPIWLSLHKLSLGCTTHTQFSLNTLQGQGPTMWNSINKSIWFVFSLFGDSSFPPLWLSSIDLNLVWCHAHSFFLRYRSFDSKIETRETEKKKKNRQWRVKEEMNWRRSKEIREIKRSSHVLMELTTFFKSESLLLTKSASIHFSCPPFSWLLCETMSFAWKRVSRSYADCHYHKRTAFSQIIVISKINERANQAGFD